LGEFGIALHVKGRTVVRVLVTRASRQLRKCVYSAQLDQVNLDFVSCCTARAGGRRRGCYLNITRRYFSNHAIQALLLVSALVLAEWQGLPIAGKARALTGWTPDISELMNPGPLPDHILGSAKATVTIIEYTSMTCQHCAEFAIKRFPKLKEKFIDTGKVRYVAREFPYPPTNELAWPAAMLVRSVSEDRYYRVMDLLLEHQLEWLSSQEALKIFALKQLGFTDETFKASLADGDLRNRIGQARDRAQNSLNVDHTPTFFINDDMYDDYDSFQKIEDLIASHLKG
jgi:protein-disulfide isomerase